MKTRIFSAAVMILLIGGFLVLGFTVSTYFITAFLILLSVIATYELLHNAAGITSRLANTGAMIAAGFITLLSDRCFCRYIIDCSEKDCIKSERVAFVTRKFGENGRIFVCIVFFLFAAFVILYKHKDFPLSKIFAFSVMPQVLSLGFSCMGRLITSEKGLYYLLLLATYACVCDTGAYFTGVAMGKHKLCPEISPKKTVEGAIGGIVSSVIVTAIIILVFNKIAPMSTLKIVLTVIFTIPLCIIGMAGDLFASQIKRSVGLKDYGNLIPGHGGILDRFDSMLLIAPALYVLSGLGMV